MLKGFSGSMRNVNGIVVDRSVLSKCPSVWLEGEVELTSLGSTLFSLAGGRQTKKKLQKTRHEHPVLVLFSIQ